MAKKLLEMDGKKFVLVPANGGLCTGCAFEEDDDRCKRAKECSCGIWKQYALGRYDFEQTWNEGKQKHD